MNQGAIFFLPLFILLWAAGCEHSETKQDSHRTAIVCFGDSLTAGDGADPGQDYPSFLRQLVNVPVINAGVSGQSTRDAMKRVEKDIFPHHPRLVIVILGANDSLQNIPKAETLRNFEEIIDKIQTQGSKVVWASVEMGIFGYSYASDFQELAQRKGIKFIPNILQDIMQSSDNKYNDVHPNNKGYRLLAGRIFKEIKQDLDH